MANRGWQEQDGRFDPSGGRHDTEDFKRYDGTVEDICALTSVEDQVKAGGWTRNLLPTGDDAAVLPRSKYVGGSAGSVGNRVNAAYPGTPSGP